MLVVLPFLLVGLAVWHAGYLLSFGAGPPVKADVVVVLGGDWYRRYAVARELVLNNYSGRILVIHPNADSRADADGQLRGVDIQFEVAPNNTWEEAQVVRNWMHANSMRSAVIVSDPPHMLRLLYVCSSVFRGSGLTYDLVAAKPDWWSASHWSSNPTSEEFVKSEALKLAYYVVRYRFGVL